MLARSRFHLLALALGAVSACAFEPLALWPLMPLCLAGLLALLGHARRLMPAVALGWCFGLGNFVVGLNWIAMAFTYQDAMPAWLGWVAVVLLSLYLAVFPALATGAAWWMAGGKRARMAPLAIMLAGCWIVSEWLRAVLFTGFAWNPIGVVLVHGGTLPLAARYVGTYGLGGMVVLLGAAILGLARAFTRRQPPLRWIGCMATLVLALLLQLWPVRSELPLPSAPLLHIVQPNIGQDQKWNTDAQGGNFARLTRLSGAPGLRPRLLLWPEVAVPAMLEQDELARLQIAALLGPRDRILTGAEAVQYGPDGEIVTASNSLFALAPDGRVLGRYDKAHLVPYGEYLPMRPLLSRLGLSRLAPGDMDFLAGPGPRNVTVPGIGQVGVQICYEIIFSGHVVDKASRPAFLFNPSNDAWFGRWGPPQHLAQARLRAIEERIPVARSTPTGISAVINRDGRLLASLPWRTAGAIELPLPAAGAATPFSRLGNLLPLLLALALVAAGFATRMRGR